MAFQILRLLVDEADAFCLHRSKSTIIISRVFSYPPIFTCYLMPFATIQVFYIEFTEHIICKFGFITCFVTIQIECIQPCRCSKTITFLNEVGILHIRIERLQASQ